MVLLLLYIFWGRGRMGTLYKYWDFIAHFYLLGRYIGDQHLRQETAKAFELYKKVLISFLINFLLFLLFTKSKTSPFSNENFPFDTPHGAVVLLTLLTFYFTFNALLSFMCGIGMRFASEVRSLENDFKKFRVAYKTLKLVGINKAPKSTLRVFAIFLFTFTVIVAFIIIGYFIHPKSNVRQITKSEYQLKRTLQ